MAKHRWKAIGIFGRRVGRIRNASRTRLTLISFKKKKGGKHPRTSQLCGELQKRAKNLEREIVEYVGMKKRDIYR